MTADAKEFWRIIITTAALVFAMLAVGFLCGCVNENTGSSTVVGEQMILPEITDSSDNIAVRVFEDIKGARVWTAKDSKVTIRYINSWTNNVFSLYESRGNMGLDVEIEPLATDVSETPGTTSQDSETADAHRQ